MARWVLLQVSSLCCAISRQSVAQVRLLGLCGIRKKCQEVICRFQAVWKHHLIITGKTKVLKQSWSSYNIEIWNFHNFSLQISPLCNKTSQGEISKNLVRNFLGESCLVTWEVLRSEVPSVQFPLSKVFVPSSCQSVSYFSKSLFNLLPFKWIKQQVASF